LRSPVQIRRITKTHWLDGRSVGRRAESVTATGNFGPGISNFALCVAIFAGQSGAKPQDIAIGRERATRHAELFIKVVFAA
jgi:hypothetical protein